MPLDDVNQAPSIHQKPAVAKGTQKPVNPSPSTALPESIEGAKVQEAPPSDSVDIPKLKASLMGLVGKINTLHTKSMDMTFEKAKVEAYVKDYEKTALQTAIEATGADGKKVNTNDVSRKAHADGILAKSDAYQQAVARAEALKIEMWKNDIELEYNRNLLRGMEIISRYRQ